MSLAKTATTQTPRWCAVIMTLWAWSSVMRNSPFSTVTTNSRGVKSSLTRITLCRRGRSTLVLILVFGLVTVSGMARRLLSLRDRSAIIPSSRRLWNQRFCTGSLQRRYGAQIGDDVGDIGGFQFRVIAIGHRLLERAPVARNALG